MGYVASAEVDGSGLAGPVALVGEVPTMQCLLSDPPARVGLSSWGPQTLGPSGSYTHNFPHELRPSPHPKEGEVSRHVKLPRTSCKLGRVLEGHLVLPKPVLQKRETGGRPSLGGHAGVGSCTEIRTGTSFHVNPKAPRIMRCLQGLESLGMRTGQLPPPLCCTEMECQRGDLFCF